MSKVILTQKQADAIIRNENEGLENSDILYRYLRFDGYDEQFRGLTFGALADALYIGYEVEPEFEVGDWYYHLPTGRIGKIDKIENGGILELRGHIYFRFDNIRHATPEEIAKEKRHRWWSARDRGVWQVYEGDILMNKASRTCFNVTSAILDDFKDLEHETLDYNYTVVCLAENREDVEE